MNIGLIGARRTSNGIGEYIGKYFHAHGERVSAVLGTTEESASQAAENLLKYGISARPYSDFSKMMEEQQLDAVVIASPVQTHKRYISQCLDAGLHIFCEKPFISVDEANMDTVFDEIFTLAGQRGITIAMNSQWVFCLPFYEELCGRIAAPGVRAFAIRLSPVCSGKEMITDSVPHALSLLYAVFGEGAAGVLHIDGASEEMNVAFTYTGTHGTCRAEVTLKTQKTQPRTFSFGFDSRTVARCIDMETYQIGLIRKGSTLMIPDPLELSVMDFISAVKERRSPVVGREHIITTSKLLKFIYDGCTIR